MPYAASTQKDLAPCAVDLVVKRALPQARVLEVGAELYSVLQPWLYQYGYRNLTGSTLSARRAA